MLTTYRAKLKGHHVEWVDEVPPLDLHDGADVLVTVLQANGHSSLDGAERGKRMKEALDKLAAAGGVSSIPEPVAWQREIREDRQLPGRED